MDNSSVIALLAAALSVVGALVSVWYTRRTTVAERLAEADRVAIRFREPLLQAAFNLQARLYNIAKLDLFGRFMTESSSPTEREYAIENTLYLFGQYFCWVEILRRESQFLDPRSQEHNRVLADRLEGVRDAFAASDAEGGPLRVFRGEQRAIAETMMESTVPPAVGVPRWDCVGYATFIRNRADQQQERWFRPLRADLGIIREEPGPNLRRLVKIQHALLDLVDLMDPSAHRVSAGMRVRL